MTEEIPGFITPNDADAVARQRAEFLKEKALETQTLQVATNRCNETLHDESNEPVKVSSVVDENCNESLQRLAAPKRKESLILMRIYDYLQESYFPVEPSKIASDLDLNPNTVRSYCHDLLRAERIKQPYPRHFCSLGCNAPIHGVGIMNRGSLYDGGVPQASSGVCVQNIIMSCDTPIAVKLSDYVYSVLDVDIRLEFGVKRNKCNLYIRGPHGCSIHAYSLIVTSAEKYMEDLGFTKPNDWLMVNYEVFVDGVKVTVGGAESYTFQAFRGDLIKLYNKEWGVRGEFHSSDPIKFKEFMSILSGHSSDIRLAARLGAVEDEIRRLTEAVKYSNAGRNLT